MKSKIAFVGNVNCMTFRYALELKRFGHEVTFFVDYPTSERLHRPEHRFEEIKYPYPDWIKEVEYPKREIEFFLPRGAIRRLISELNQESYDVVVLNGIWHKVAFWLSKRIHVMCFFSGSDLDVKANYEAILAEKHSSNWLFNIVKVVLRLMETWLHRQGIRRSTLINYFPEGVLPAADTLIAKIMSGRKYTRLQVRGVTVDDVEYSAPSLCVGRDLVIFNPTRFLWKEPLPSGYVKEENKRNDIMLRGIADFVSRTNLTVSVILVEKGVHLSETKALIEALGIGHLVKWVKEMSQAEIFHYYREADIVFDQLGKHWVGQAGLDAMLVGRAVIANGRPEVFTRILGEPIPLCQATDEKEVSDWLVKLADDPELRLTIGKRCRDFVIKHFNAKDTASAIVSHIDGFQLR